MILSYPKLPGMSGIEVLRVVRRRFPATPMIAMSSFSGDEAPSGVVADAFCQKGSSPRALLMIVEALSLMERRPSSFWHRDANAESGTGFFPKFADKDPIPAVQTR